MKTPIADDEQEMDLVDARLLNRILATRIISEVHQKSSDQREICRLVRHPDVLVEERDRLTSRMHSHLHQQGLEYRDGALLTEDGRRWLQEEAWTVAPVPRSEVS